ncbi:hypothetical protein B4135_0354 [Caldibacillus debilis]|uniref:Uncharacterized protein n=1 Tax=Caldibacillus debilis TaxID=301148 RepID=A0A150M4B7_9BACI|nr:hypothetical protein B4135_0354 [Caldibacillus debilis]
MLNILFSMLDNHFQMLNQWERMPDKPVSRPQKCWTDFSA